MNIEELFNKRIKQLNRHRRTAYLPVFAKNENTFSNESKLGGFPYLRNKRDWPICSYCNESMRFLLQLNLNNLPEFVEENALLQLFECSTFNCKIWNDFSHFSEKYLCRKLRITRTFIPTERQFDIFTKHQTSRSGRIHIWNEKLITGWQMQNDYPDEEEYKQLGIEKFKILHDYEVCKLMHKRQIGLTISGIKLFGWPYWFQSPDYPFDKVTGNKMNLLFQSGESFADCIGFLMQSPDNLYNLAYIIQCT